MVSEQSQLPPSSNIIQPQMTVSAEDWFEYPIKVHPHHTDYAGIVWHGRYMQWLEEARIELLRSRGIDFSELVAMGCNLPVVDFSIRYHQSMRMGEEGVLKTRLIPMEGVRIPIEYELYANDRTILTGRVTLVAVDLEKGKVMRRLPPGFMEALTK
jgi:acyl-CoA thioester hydrolase